MFVVKWVMGWLTGGALGTLKDIWFKYKDSAIESERIQAEWAKAQLDARLQVRLATAGFWEMRLFTALIALPFVIHVLLVGFDTITTGTRFEIIGWQVAAFPAPFHEWEGMILLSFFGIHVVGKIGNGVISAIAGRK